MPECMVKAPNLRTFAECVRDDGHNSPHRNFWGYEWPPERNAAPLTVPDPSPSTPERDGASSVDSGGLDDPYQRAARAYIAGNPAISGTNPQAVAPDLVAHAPFRAAVDAAREDLAAEVARVTAERDQARARITELRNWVREELDEIDRNPDVSSGEATWEEGGYASALRNVMGRLGGTDG